MTIICVALSSHPDIILLDIIMPVMDGMTMLNKLRCDPWGAHATVIILTNLSDAEDPLVLFPHRSLDYLVKSDWRLEDVVTKVKKMLKKQAAEEKGDAPK
ncbi:MAG: response regulator [Candidatus Doudnabacteria bacterium]